MASLKFIGKTNIWYVFFLASGDQKSANEKNLFSLEEAILTLMLPVPNLANTIGCKKTEK